VFVILMAWFDGELVMCLVYLCLLLYILTKSLCFTCYTSLYLLNYAYHCAMMSSNEM
jgi:hypothetical protein